MANETVSKESRTPNSDFWQSYWFVAIWVIALSMSAVFVLKGGIRYEPLFTATYPFNMVFVGIGCLVFSFVRYTGTIGTIDFLLRGMNAIVVFYIATNWFGFVPESVIDRTMLDYGRWVALAFGIAGFWRPSLTVFATCYVMVSKELTVKHFGGFISSTDYLIVAEMIFFCVTAICALDLYRRFGGKITGMDENGFHHPLQIAFIFVLGSHFANYFFSGVRKVFLEFSDPFTWISNQTYNLAAAFAHSGNVPYAHIEPFFTESILLYVSTAFIVNSFVFFTQLGAILAFFRKWTLILFTFFYDVMHMGIFIFTGIFFWKWILLNSIIIAALTKLPIQKMTRPFVIAGLAGILVSDLAFSTEWLGWYDTRTFEHEKIVAVTKDGKEYHVPSNYFLSASVNFAQQRMTPMDETFTPFRTLVTIEDYGLMQTANKCEVDLPKKTTLSQESINELERLVQQHHAYVLENVDGAGRIYYDLYPHHIWSNPFLFPEFMVLDKREIEQYKYVTEVFCLEYDMEARKINYRPLNRYQEITFDALPAKL